MKIKMTHRQIRELLDLSESSGDPEFYDDMALVFVEEDTAHSGPGLYCQFQELPEEGYMFLAATDEEEASAEAIFQSKVASGDAQEL